jgi:hypothetical protein
MASGKQVLCHKESPDSDVRHARTEAPDLREGYSADGEFAASREPKGSGVVPYRSTHALGPHVAPQLLISNQTSREVEQQVLAARDLRLSYVHPNSANRVGLPTNLRDQRSTLSGFVRALASA